MKIPEHLTLSLLLAQLGVQQEHGLAGTALVLAAGCLPDLDGLSLLFGARAYHIYHRVLGHGVLVTLLGPVGLAVVGHYLLDLPWTLWWWLQAALLAHLVTDVCFYDWPVLLLWPFSSRGWGLGWLSWNDLVPTILLYAGSLVTVTWPPLAVTVATVTLALFAVYLGWRAVRPRPAAGFGAWLTGDWAHGAPRFYRWLTGDFVICP